MTTRPDPAQATPAPRDHRELSYTNALSSRPQRALIQTIEWLTGKLRIVGMVRAFERRGGATGRAFWPAVLDVMGIEIITPSAQIDRIPKDGPLVIVANHPHGLVDGLILAELVSRVRDDFQILNRELKGELGDIVAPYLIAVPFSHDPEAQAKGKAMRAEALEKLGAGGVVCVFPSGEVASSQTAFGPVEEAAWNVFSAQLIRRSGAKVVPVHFQGGNSRWYQIANRLSPTLRQAMLLHEVVRICNRRHAPVIGEVLSEAQMAALSTDPRGFITWLRTHTLTLEG